MLAQNYYLKDLDTALLGFVWPNLDNTAILKLQYRKNSSPEDTPKILLETLKNSIGDRQSGQTSNASPEIVKTHICGF